MKFQKKYTFLFFISFLGMAISTQGQVLINTYTYTHNTDKITEEQRETMEKAVVATVKQYYDYADFLDDATGMVTASSVKRFRNLFQSSSRILNDLTIGVNSHYSDYSSSVLDFLPNGVKFEMPTALLTDMDYDEAGYYVIEMQTEKTVYTGLSYTNEPEFCKTGRDYKLKFTFIIEEDDLNTAKISKISGSNSRRCEDAKPFIGFGLRGAGDFIGTSSYANSSFLDTEMAGLNVETGTTWNVGAGVSLQLPITKKELIFLNIGANYSVFGLSTDISESFTINNAEIVGATAVGNGLNGQFVADKRVSVGEGKEEITVHAVEFPVGIRYRKPFKTMQQLSFVADVFFVTTLQLFSSSTLSARSVDYDLTVDTNPNSTDPIFSAELPSSAAVLNNFGAGTAEDGNALISSQPEIQNNLSFGIRIAPGIQYELNDNLFLEATLEYSMGLTSFFSSDNVVQSSAITGNTVDETEMKNYFLPDAGSKPAVGNLMDELEMSFVERYIEETKISTLGLRVGVVYLFNK